MHRKDSQVPFEHALASLRFEDFALQDNQLILNNRLTETFVKYTKYKQSLLKIPYFSVADYLFLLAGISRLLAPLGKRALLFLAAAVSDFYLDDAFISEHKIPSSANNEEGLSIHLSPVPKFIRLLKEEICPAAFIISFKLETDESKVLEKAKVALERYKHDLVIANILATRKEKLWIVHPGGKTVLIQKQSGFPIEHELVQAVVQLTAHQ